MQKVAAYLLQRDVNPSTAEARGSEAERIRGVIERWLESKGAASGGVSGKYAAVDGSDASYRVSEASDGERSWRLYELSEVTAEGRRFATSVSVTAGAKDVFVFVTMEVGSLSSSINHIDVEPKCPKVVRDLLALDGTWRHGASRLTGLSAVEGFDPGILLALELERTERAVPVVVISRRGGESVLPELAERLASDLAGLATVFTIDEEAAWALTDMLRRPFACYGGAVRIYWPRLSGKDDPRRHPLWTAQRIREAGDDARQALERIRRQVRKAIMSASAASVVRPHEIDDIRNAVSRAELAALQAKANALEEMKAKASSLREFQELADSYAEDNDRLRRDLADRDEEIVRLRDEVQRLDAEKQALVFHLEKATGQAEESVEIEPDAPEADEAAKQPQPGEVRFYKKRYSTKTHDVLVQIADCGHSAWQSAEKADKARKGLARLLGDQHEWKSLHHCGTCTGGGVWRVRW